MSLSLEVEVEVQVEERTVLPGSYRRGGARVDPVARVAASIEVAAMGPPPRARTLLADLAADRRAARTSASTP